MEIRIKEEIAREPQSIVENLKTLLQKITCVSLCNRISLSPLT